MWSWSHTAEAYENLRQRIEHQDREWLEVVWGEWKAATSGHFLPTGSSVNDFDFRRYERAHAAAKYMSTELLAERIYELAERQALCTNGGFDAMCCPYYCGVHTLSFDPVEDADE